MLVSHKHKELCLIVFFHLLEVWKYTVRFDHIHAPFPQFLPGTLLHNFVSSPHIKYNLYYSHTLEIGISTRPWLTYERIHHKRKLTILPEGTNCQNFFLLGASLHAYISYLCWNFDWFELAQVLYMCTYLMVSGKLFLVIRCLWLLQFFQLLFHKKP